MAKSKTRKRPAQRRRVDFTCWHCGNVEYLMDGAKPNHCGRCLHSVHAKYTLDGMPLCGGRMVPVNKRHVDGCLVVDHACLGCGLVTVDIAAKLDKRTIQALTRNGMIRFGDDGTWVPGCFIASDEELAPIREHYKTQPG